MEAKQNYHYSKKQYNSSQQYPYTSRILYNINR